jgi:V-type H+-transporting ATPase subunit D
MPPPTRMALGVFKAKLKGAKKGFELLKKKADALKMRLQAMTKEIYNLKMLMSDQASEAYFSVTEAEYSAGKFQHKVMDAIDSNAEVTIESSVENVAGVKLPVFSTVDTGEGKAKEAKQSIGLGKGGKAVTTCAEKFKIFLEAMVKLASLQTSFQTLDEALKVTNRRVNALENVTLPRITGVIEYIKKELDEMEREEFTRVKKLKEKKEKKLQEKKRAEEAEGKARNSMGSPSKSALEGYDQAADPDVVDW